MYQYKLSPGHRVTWCHDFTQIKAQITRVWKNQVEILTADFVKIKVPLDELELIPLIVRVQESLREQKSCTLTPNHWIEEKMIKRAGKLHGPYRLKDGVMGAVKPKVSIWGKRPRGAVDSSLNFLHSA